MNSLIRYFEMYYISLQNISKKHEKENDPQKAVMLICTCIYFVVVCVCLFIFILFIFIFISIHVDTTAYIHEVPIINATEFITLLKAATVDLNDFSL